MSLTVRIPQPSELESMRLAVGEVAAERVYLNRIEAPKAERFLAIMHEQLAKKLPIAVAVHGDRVVGWADVRPHEAPFREHRGELGMGVLQAFRGQGLGQQLLASVLAQAEACGFEKVELNVYSANMPALKMYEKLGFARCGLIKHYRKLEGTYFDCVMMEKFL